MCLKNCRSKWHRLIYILRTGPLAHICTHAPVFFYKSQKFRWRIFPPFLIKKQDNKWFLWQFWNSTSENDYFYYKSKSPNAWFIRQTSMWYQCQNGATYKIQPMHLICVLPNVKKIIASLKSIFIKVEYTKKWSWFLLPGRTASGQPKRCLYP